MLSNEALLAMSKKIIVVQTRQFIDAAEDVAKKFNLNIWDVISNTSRDSVRVKANKKFLELYQAKNAAAVSQVLTDREIEKFIIRQPPTGEKDDYDSENSWISDGLPSSSRRRGRGGGRWEVGGGRVEREVKCR